MTGISWDDGIRGGGFSVNMKGDFFGHCGWQYRGNLYF